MVRVIAQLQHSVVAIVEVNISFTLHSQKRALEGDRWSLAIFIFHKYLHPVSSFRQINSLFEFFCVDIPKQR